ncbi:hypothetical protein [Streptomyces sp. NPDC057554]|uniref:hypothetical protein n=1 Tax=Streptomyces sp. NPDC057554 TaxID=3350538 RepID=UPI003675C12E
MSQEEFVDAVRMVVHALQGVVTGVEYARELPQVGIEVVAAMDLEGLGHDLIEIAARRRMALYQADELTGQVEADMDQVPVGEASDQMLADFWSALARCCDLHQDVGCCDEKDCGPCCAQCPTCPTRPRTGEEGQR